MTKVTKPLAGVVAKPTDKDLAELCSIAYAPFEQAVKAFNDRGWNVKVSSSSNEMYVLYQSTLVVVVFTGSNNWRDWASNLNVTKTPGGRHRGFWERFCKFKLGGIANRDTIFTGHSLGAAMAVYAASQYDAMAITFGEPMNADTDIMRGLTHIRYVNNMDIVPKLPPIGYKHYGELRYFDYYGKLHFSPSWLQIIKDRFMSRLKAIIKLEKFDDFYDHEPLEYYNKLK